MTHAESQERRQSIIKDYLAGLSRQEIRDKYNIPYIQSYIQGVKRVRCSFTKKLTTTVKTRMLEMHKEGKNHYEIAEEVKLDFRYVLIKLKEWGLKPYKIKRQPKEKIKAEKVKFTPIELTEGEQRIKNNLKKLDEKIKREGGIPMNYGMLDPLITVQPKHRYA